LSNLIRYKKESRQNHSKALTINNMFSLETLSNINKEKIGNKIFNDLSFNYLKNYTITSHPNNTYYMNHSHKKLVKNGNQNSNHNKKIFHNLSKAKFKKYPLKLNYKQSKSLKNLLDEEKLFNLNLRPNHSRKNTNTKIELFSTNSTLSFLNVKENNKDMGKSAKIKNINQKSKIKKKFAATFIENKIKQYIKNNSNNKNKNFDKGNISSYTKYRKNIIKNNKSHELYLSYSKYINKKRNKSYIIKDDINKNTNSIKEFSNISINKNYTNSTNILLDNISLSINKSKNKKRINSKNKLIKKELVDKYNTTCSINNKNNRKLNLCSLPNLLCNNFIFKFSLNDKSDNIKKYKNRSSFQNLLEHKKQNKNINKIKIINNKKLKKLFKNFKTINKVVKDIKSTKNSKSEEKININKNTEDIKFKLNKIETGVKSLLDGFYSIYLKSKQNDKIK